MNGVKTETSFSLTFSHCLKIWIFFYVGDDVSEHLLFEVFHLNALLVISGVYEESS